MKKVFLMMAMAVMTLGASAQAWVGGTLGFGYQNSKVDGSEAVKTTSFEIAPEVGYSVTDNFAVALEFAYDYAKAGDVKNMAWKVGPYVRYTFTNNETVNWFGELGAHYMSTKQKGPGYDTGNIGGFDIVLRPGVSVALSDNWSLLAKMNLFEYGHAKKDDYKVNQYGFHILQGFSIGFAYKF